MRHNKYKDKILSVLGKAHLMSLKEIYGKVADADYSTVYRNLKQLEDDGCVRSVVVKQNVKLYELAKCSNDHFMCVDCGSVEAIHLKEGLAVKLGGVVDVLVRGHCRDCRRVKN